MEPKEHEHVTFNSGAQRSDRIGKGRFDLISPYGLKRLAIQYEAGAVHHTDARNWSLGFPISRALCSTMSHINDHMRGDRSEDHLAAAAWQLFAAMHFEELIERGELPVALNDVPFDANTLPPDTGAEPIKFYVSDIKDNHVTFNVIVSDGSAGELCMPKTEFESLVKRLSGHVTINGLQGEAKDDEPKDNFPFARMVEEPFGEIQRMTGSWADAKYPKTDSIAICKHLEREVEELMDAIGYDAAISIEKEAADCLLLLMHIAHKGKFNLLTAAIDKYIVNLGRKWATEPDADGIYPHIDEE